jgi:hypothetical protein
VFIDMTERYLLGEKYEACKHLSCVHRGDAGIGGFILRADVAPAFAYMICHAYVNQRPTLTPSIVEYTKMWCQGDEDVAEGVSDWLTFGNPGDFVSCRDIAAAAKERGHDISSTKLGSIIRSELGVTSAKKSINNKKMRGYSGLRIESDDSLRD